LPEPSVTFTMRLPYDADRKLRELAVKHQRPMTFFVRRAVELYLIMVEHDEAEQETLA
jgi:predicted transcriptional regulator